jgi:hypothetical protein
MSLPDIAGWLIFCFVLSCVSRGLCDGLITRPCRALQRPEARIHLFPIVSIPRWYTNRCLASVHEHRVMVSRVHLLCIRKLVSTPTLNMSEGQSCVVPTDACDVQDVQWTQNNWELGKRHSKRGARWPTVCLSMYSITENIYYPQLSSVAILLQSEPVFTSYSTRKRLGSLSCAIALRSSLPRVYL